ncbi:hypothetical protein BDZ91DRAFT_723696 [Kalaharituber pfeilii]|nr:hypothetical protein BDZ91DRAFT_723696 [Kalaharituber pfeilii]
MIMVSCTRNCYILNLYLILRKDGLIILYFSFFSSLFPERRDPSNLGNQSELLSLATPLSVSNVNHIGKIHKSDLLMSIIYMEDCILPIRKKVPYVKTIFACGNLKQNQGSMGFFSLFFYLRLIILL